MNLRDLGWDRSLEKQFESFQKKGLTPARVARERRRDYVVFSSQGELVAKVSGKFRHAARSRAELPTVGDWVGLVVRPDEQRGTIHVLLPRKSSFSRKAVLSGGMPDTGGRTEQQVLAANVDVVFLVGGLDGDFNLRRIERYVAVAWDSGAIPVVVLNKIDLCDNVEKRVQEVESIAPGLAVLAVSATGNQGLDELHEYVAVGKTAAFLGSSGVGKSTLINKLIGSDRLEVRPVREHDSRGRHTTTSRDMLILPSGGVVIDTPGLREIQMWSDEGGLEQTFDDIESLAARCRFRDCRHEQEPGCAVQAALQDATLDAGRYQSYLKLKRELKHLAMRQNPAEARRAQRQRGKMIRQHFKEVKKQR
ncbi:MAG TPA: ribosome small subunit-dependent GTPase A [Acidobacteriota bacterium]|nr:ribosome small subunit-dependent GTPase A [Acidobacteriota bacterium]